METKRREETQSERDFDEILPFSPTLVFVTGGGLSWAGFLLESDSDTSARCMSLEKPCSDATLLTSPALTRYVPGTL